VRPDDGSPQDTSAIFIAPDGPYVVTGGPELRNTALGGGALRACFELCRCGGSRNKPFCDGSHRRIGFKDEKN
jgi:CDGSH-type Zn-finger protein